MIHVKESYNASHIQRLRKLVESGDATDDEKARLELLQEAGGRNMSTSTSIINQVCHTYINIDIFKILKHNMIQQSFYDDEDFLNFAIT